MSWQSQRGIVPEGLLPTRVTLREDPLTPRHVEVWHRGQRYGVAVRADQAVPSALGASTPPAAPEPATRLYDLDLLTDLQAARRPGVPYAREEGSRP